jgi:hypothetical protein
MRYFWAQKKLLCGETKLVFRQGQIWDFRKTASWGNKNLLVGRGKFGIGGQAVEQFAIQHYYVIEFKDIPTFARQFQEMNIFIFLP